MNKAFHHHCVVVLMWVLLFSTGNLFAQQTTEGEYTEFFYEDGSLSSKGHMLDGKPNGYWKSFYPNGMLKSEGNRKNFELDSTWLFYDEEGRITLEINYKEGKMHGERVSYLPDVVIREHFKDDIKHGLSRHFSPSGRLIKSIPFQNGLEQGLARHYDERGNIIELITYDRGFITNRERINRYDANNKKNGVWKWFYDSGELKSEGVFRHGMRHGVFKEYDRNGKLTHVAKYLDDVLQETASEVAQVEIRRDYYPSGKIRVEAAYRNGVPEGVRREYNEEGEVENAYFFRNGIMVAEGILSESGQREGLWKEYYLDGSLKARGYYTADQRSGDWEFYYPNGQLEQKGTYNNEGKPEGEWLWYYENGYLLRREHFVNGLLDGMMTEYQQNGKVLTQGDFIEGLEEGFWFYEHGHYREEGEYAAGMRNGQWKHFYKDGTISFEGRFIDDNPNGEHIWYWPNGRKRTEGAYIMGRRNGDWYNYDKEGNLLLIIGYVNGIERSYDGVNIPEEDLILLDD